MSCWCGVSFTMYYFYMVMFVEFVVVLVDSDHRDLHTLAKEVGVEMQDLTTEGGEELYFFKGQFHTPKDIVDPEKKSGAFAPIAKQITHRQARELDQARQYEHQGLSGPVSRQKPMTGRSICSMWRTTSNSGCSRKINPAWR